MALTDAEALDQIHAALAAYAAAPDDLTAPQVVDTVTVIIQQTGRVSNVHPSVTDTATLAAPEAT